MTLYKKKLFPFLCFVCFCLCILSTQVHCKIAYAADTLSKGDLNEDGTIDVLDLSLLKQYLLGIIKEFPGAPKQNTSFKVMALGDSITDGLVVPGGYRIKLWEHFKENNLTVDFVGSSKNGPSQLEDKDHEGHSGWRIDQIDANIATWMSSTQPDIVLLHIGTNDIAQNYNVTTAPSRLSTLIDKICTRLPSRGKLFVAQITPLGNSSWNDKIKQFNKEIPGIVQEKRNLGKNVYMVDMFSPLTSTDLADGVHPNQVGYDKMADVWFKAIQKEFLNH